MINEVISTNEIISENAVISSLNGLKSEDRSTNPRTRVKFVRLEPIALALARRMRPRLTAVRLKLNYGSDVPKATTSAPTTMGATAKLKAISRAEETANLADRTTMSVPPKTLTNIREIGPRFFSLT